MKDKVEVFSLNVRGLGSDIKRRKIFTWLQKQDIPIAMLQETHSTQELQNQWRAEWGGDAYFSHGSSRARGTVILLNPSLKNVEVHEVKTCDNGRYVAMDLTIAETRLTLVNIYGPNVDDPHFFQSVMEVIENMPNDNRIVGGDFNLVLQLDKDKKGGRFSTHKQAQETLLNWMEDSDMVDVWRMQHKNLSQYTYHTTYPSDISCRLDFFLVSFGMLQYVHKSSITHGYLTDHSSVRIIINTAMQPRGRGFWKLNTSLLKDQEYVTNIKDAIQLTVENNANATPLLLWDTIKLQCRGRSIEYSSRKKKQKKNKIRELEEIICDLQKTASVVINQEVHAKLEKAKSDLDKEIEQITRGNIIRSRARWCEEGERSSNYFLNLEKRNYNNKTITKLKTINGKILTDRKAILEEQQSFYSKLYSSRDIDEAIENDDTFFNQNSPKLTPTQSEDCEGLLSEVELLSALKNTKNNKAPGPDGFPCEFYKMFWGDLKEYFVNAVNHAFAVGELSITQKQGAISLLPKKGRDPLLLKNWRPLSLLNQDYKLIAKSIAARMKKHLSDIIHSDQTGFINGRFIGENIVRIFDIMDHVEEQKIPAVIMSIDYEKAFDCIEWKYIDKVLDFFGFGHEFRKWVTILYTDIESCVVNNGWTTRFFKLSRGVRQGCPLSPYLFVLGAELLSLAVRSNNEIRGITINGINHKITQYADDTALTLLAEPTTLKKTFNLLIKFSDISGLRINIEKTKIMRIGTLRESNLVLLPEYNVEWTSDSLNMLGVVIANDRSKLSELNYEPKLKKIENTIAVWRQRNLTIYGKTIIIKTFLISQIVYLMSVLPSPSRDFITRLERILFQFLWNNKVERIRRTTLFLPLNEGGIKMPHLPSFNYSIKLSWLKRLLQTENTQAWKSLFLCNMPLKDDVFWKCNLSKDDLGIFAGTMTSEFWKEVLEAFCIFNFKADLTDYDVKTQVIWFNSFIKVQDKVVFFKDCYEAGIIFISDILNDDGLLMTYEQLKTKFNHLRLSRLAYYGLVSAIPRIWKQRLGVRGLIDCVDSSLSTPEKVLSMDKVCQKTYMVFVTKHVDTQRQYTGIRKWEVDLGLQYDNDEYYNLFTNVYRCTPSTSLRAFQYFLIHRALVTNMDLYKWKIKDSSICTFCRLHPESIFHLLWECDTVSTLWSEIFIWLNIETSTNIIFSPQEILLGSGQENLALYDLILLIAKKYIYACRCLDLQPTLIGFVHKVKHVYETEVEGAKLHNKSEKCANKWALLFEGD